MRLTAALSGTLAAFMAEEVRKTTEGVSNAVRTAALGAKAEVRAQVTGAGLGTKLANTVRSESYPRGRPSIEAAGLIYTRAPNILESFEKGSRIRSQDGFFLAIPTPEAGATGLSREGGRSRLTPGSWERRTGRKLRFVYRAGAPSLLVADNMRLGRAGKSGVRIAQANESRRKGGVATRLAGRTTVVIFVLVPQVRMPKKLDIAGVGERWAARLPSILADELKRQDRAA